jgi:predicted dehydrogenase
MRVGFMRRYDPAYSAAMKRIEAEIGTSHPQIDWPRQRWPAHFGLSSQHQWLSVLQQTVRLHWHRWFMRDEVARARHTTACVRPKLRSSGGMVAGPVIQNCPGCDAGTLNTRKPPTARCAHEIVGSKGQSCLKLTNSCNLVNHARRTQALQTIFTTFADAYVAEMQDFVERILQDRRFA